MKYGAAEVCMLQGFKGRQQIYANHDDALGLKGATNADNGRGQMRPENISNQRVAEAGLRGAFDEVCQHEAALLELRENSVAGLPFRGNLSSFEYLASFACKVSFRRIEEIGIARRTGAAEQKSLDVHRTIAGSPLKPLEATSDVPGGGKLPATITAEKACACGSHAKA